MQTGGLPAAGFADVAKTVTPAVVNITTRGAEDVSDRARPRGKMEDFLDHRSAHAASGRRWSRENIGAAAKGPA